MESFERKNDPAPRGVDRQERLRMIFERLDGAPAAHTAREAHELLTNVFRGIESDHEPEGQQRMDVLPLNEDFVLSYAGRVVHFQHYNRHILFIDEGGAIDIRFIERDKVISYKLLQRDPTYPREQMKCIFEKPGADGHRVWDDEA